MKKLIFSSTLVLIFLLTSFTAFAQSRSKQKIRYSGRVEAQWGSEYNLSVLTSHGIQFNKHLQLRGGTGFILPLFNQDHGDGSYYNQLGIPMFIELGGMMLDRKVSPTYLVRSGIEHYFYQSKVWTNHGYYERERYDNTFFTHFSIGCGIQFRRIRIEPYMGLTLRSKDVVSNNNIEYVTGFAMCF